VANCTANANIVDRNGELLKRKYTQIFKNNKYFDLSTRYVLTPNKFVAASLVFRRSLLQHIEWLLTVPAGDHAIVTLMLAQGKGYFINDITCCYRVHPGSLEAGGRRDPEKTYKNYYHHA